MKTNYKKGVVVRGIVALIALCLFFGWAVSSVRDNVSEIDKVENTNIASSTADLLQPISSSTVDSVDIDNKFK